MMSRHSGRQLVAGASRLTLASATGSLAALATASDGRAFHILMSPCKLIGLHDGDLSLLYVFNHLLLFPLHGGAGYTGKLVEGGDSGAGDVDLVL